MKKDPAQENNGLSNGEMNGDKEGMDVDKPEIKPAVEANGNPEDTSNGNSVEHTKKEDKEDSDQEMEDDNGEVMDDEDEEEDEPVAYLRGPAPPEEGYWASCIRVLDPVSIDLYR